MSGGTDTLERPLARKIAGLGAIDCDVHPRSPVRTDLLPYLSDYWREIFVTRSIDQLDLTGYPEPTRPYRLPGSEAANHDADALGKALLDPLGLDAAILNVVSGIHAIYDPYLSAALCEATNRWIAEEWLARDTRLRASLLVPFVNPDAAVKEIERCAADRRFVQVLAIVMGEMPAGRLNYWPIYEAAQKHGFALAIHAGSNYRHAPTQCGFPSYLVEEHVAQAQGFGTQVASLLAEGVFAKFPELKVVLAESGVTWLPSLMWRMSKDWRGVRIEVPWLDESPAELVRRHIRMTTQPFDGPAGVAEKAISHLLSDDMLLFSTDFPHDHGGRLEDWPASLPNRLATKIARDNARATYQRLEL